MYSQNLFKIQTHLKDIYENSGQEIEHLYEGIRNKFKKIYSSEPSFFIKIPKIITLLGDNVTNSFEEKVVTTYNHDMIICGNTKNADSINIEFYDHAFPRNSLNLETIEPDYQNQYLKYIHNGYLSVKDFVKPLISLGLNLLIRVNGSDLDDKEILISLFIGTIYSSIIIYDGYSWFDKNSLYRYCLEQINKLNDFSKYSVHIFYLLFLDKGEIGIYWNKTFTSVKIDKKYYIGIFESFSPSAPKYYSDINYHNKRKIEIRLGLALILIKSKKLIKEELIIGCKSINNFLKLYDNDISSIYEVLNHYIKKSAYKFDELKEEIENIKDFISDIDYYENILSARSGLFIYNRILYLLNEYERINKIYFSINYNDNFFENVILSEIKNSSDDMKNNLDCYSENINVIMNIINNNKIYSKIASDGWGGSVFSIGYKDEIEIILNKIINFYKKSEERGGNFASYWISDEIENYCHLKLLNSGKIEILNPIYEDFMI